MTRVCSNCYICSRRFSMTHRAEHFGEHIDNTRQVPAVNGADQSTIRTDHDHGRPSVLNLSAEPPDKKSPTLHSGDGQPSLLSPPSLPSDERRGHRQMIRRLDLVRARHLGHRVHHRHGLHRRACVHSIESRAKDPARRHPAPQHGQIVRDPPKFPLAQLRPIHPEECVQRQRPSLRQPLYTRIRPPAHGARRRAELRPAVGPAVDRDQPLPHRLGVHSAGLIRALPKDLRQFFFDLLRDFRLVFGARPQQDGNELRDDEGRRRGAVGLRRGVEEGRGEEKALFGGAYGAAVFEEFGGDGGALEEADRGG
mmetsp:Transcript_14609/g.37325  ORF Transcript_14609/g.37325 Transcript_14609/m.37325 type:complete len:310 (+) Transcript_14609:184-1113(+)